nr:unnamed protein product [Hydra vulgaris]
MPNGLHKSKRPSGCEQLKAKKKKCKALKSLHGSILNYVERRSDGPGSSKDVVLQSTFDTDSFDASGMHSPTEQIEPEMEEIDSEIYEIVMDNMDEFEREADAEKQSHNDTVNVMTSQVNKKNWNVLSDSSFSNVPVPDNFWVEIIKRGSSLFQNKEGPFSNVTRQYARAKGGLRKLSKNRFYKTMPNGEKILWSWMANSLQNLAFRGQRENESSLNKGNFLQMLEMLPKYDPVLKEHLMRLKQTTSTTSVSYLSPQTQNKLIKVLANHVKEILINDIKAARYFETMFDSTPDISDTDQTSEVVRYVKIHNGEVEVREEVSL